VDLNFTDYDISTRVKYDGDDAG